MQLVKNIIEIKIGLYEEFKLKRNYLRAFSHFYSCFNLALVILGKRLEENKSKKINRLWKKLLTDEEVNKKYLEKMRMYIDEDMKQVIKAQKMMDKEIESSDYYKSKLGEKGAILVVGYAYPEN